MRSIVQISRQTVTHSFGCCMHPLAHVLLRSTTLLMLRRPAWYRQLDKMLQVRRSVTTNTAVSIKDKAGKGRMTSFRDRGPILNY